MEKILLDNFLKNFHDGYKEVYGRKMPSQKVKSVEGFFYDKFNNVENYISYLLEKSKCKAFIIANLADNEPLGKRIGIPHLYIDNSITSKDLSSYLQNLREYYGDFERPMTCSQLAKDKKIISKLKDNGFIEHSYHLVGSVKDSLKAASSLKNDPNLKVTFTNSKTVKKRLVQIELQAFRDEPKSLPYDHIMRDPKTCERFCMANLTSSLVWKVNYKKEEIGLIAFKINDGVAHIQTIALAKDYRGKGLGRIIYREGLKGILEHGARIYTGVSATRSVIENAKYLNRRIYNVNLKTL